MSTTKLLFALILLSSALFAQTPAVSEAPANFAAAGVSWNPGASPSIAGTGLYARLIAGTGTYAFGVTDALPASEKPFQLNPIQTNFGGGIAQKITTLKFGGHLIPVYIPTAAGVSYTGQNVGWAWSTGGLLGIPISQTWRLMPCVRVLKSSITPDKSIIATVLIGWGW